MKKLICAVMLVLCASPLFAYQGVGQPSSKESVLAVIQRFNEARKVFDPAALESTLTPDYVEISPLGEVDPHDKVLGFYKPAETPADQPALDSYSLDEIVFHTYGNTAIVIGKLTFTLKMPDGTKPSHALRASFVCRRTGDQWKIAFTQYTGIRPQTQNSASK